jgi:tRNA-Thr(GGU) m(6)t(6)A37 methyltransferase TsaA
MSLNGHLRAIGVVKKAGEQEAQIHVFPKFKDGLKGITDFSHIIVLYWAHLRTSEEERNTLQVYPKRHGVKTKVGVFACRSPTRPNPIGFCVVELMQKNGCDMTVKGLDAFEGSPILDIKPYLPRADVIQDAYTPEWSWRGPQT